MTWRSSHDGLQVWEGLLIGMILLAVGCQPAAKTPAPGSPPHDAVRSANFLDPGRIRVGDTLLGLRISSMDARPSPMDSAGWIGEARFEGAIALSGEYRPHFDYPEPSAPCFFADSASAARLPRFANDQRHAWFCFTNADTARQWLGPPPGRRKADIVVDQYRYLYFHTDVFSTARLVRVNPGP